MENEAAGIDFSNVTSIIIIIVIFIPRKTIGLLTNKRISTIGRLPEKHNAH